MTINEIQDEIIEQFALLGDDREMTVDYIIELGQKLPAMPEEYKTDQNLVKGCQSKVWLHTERSADGRVLFIMDSNTSVVKGLVSLLVKILSNQKAADVATTDLYFIDRIGMSNVISSQRSNGLSSVIKQMKMYAIAHQAH